MVRPGHAIYGYVSPARGHAPAKNSAGETRADVAGQLLSVKDVPRGCADRLRRNVSRPAPMRIAVLAAGYADGIPHRLVEPRQRDCGREAVPDLGRRFHGSDDYRRHASVRRRRWGCRDAAWDRKDKVSIDAQQIAKMGRNHFLQRAMRHSRAREADIFVGPLNRPLAC